MICKFLPLRLLTIALLSTAAVQVGAQEFPGKPIRIIASPPGGANNFIARLVAQGLNETAGWSVIVDNRPSGGFIQGEMLMRSPPDGHTLLVAAGSFSIGPLLEKSPYDVMRDFSPVCLAITAPSVLLVHPSMPIKSVKQLIALAKAKPGELNFSTSGTGSANHLPAELFKHFAGVNLVRVNYKGAGPALTGLLGGEVHLMFATASSATPHIASGRVRGLAITSAKRSELVNLPTIAESGVPGYDFTAPAGVLAPARTPPSIVRRLNQEIVRALKQPEMTKRFMLTGSEVVASTPEEYSAAIAAELAIWGKIIKQAGLTSQ